MRSRLRIPGEWEKHEACWLAFPYLAEEWPEGLAEAQRAIAALCQSIAGPGREAVRLMVKDERVEARARELIGDSVDVEYVRADYGDCWVRDTAPLFGFDSDGALGGLQFTFNCWGSKYDIPFDSEVGDWLRRHVGARAAQTPLVLEGGALEYDGEGTFLTTASCVLNANRNPDLTREAFEEALEALVVVDRLIWFEEGLAHDHTDGHVDMIARFAAPGKVLCMGPDRASPNAQVLESVVERLRQEGLTPSMLPAAPAIRSPSGAPLPATYCNFYVANAAVIVPTYGVAEDALAMKVIAEAFDGREVIGLPARDLLCGGGAFHCATQPQPAYP